jgi:hypothetical protein
MAALIALLACGQPAPPPDPCEQAWAEAEAAGTELLRLNPEAKVPSQADFLAACRGLPEEARRCVSLDVAVSDPSCREALDRVPEDQRRAFEHRLRP